MMAALECEAVARVGADRKLMLTTRPGAIPAGTARNGSPAIVEYTAGAFVLADDAGRVIVGPVQIEAAQALAEAVACGNARAMTEPQNSLVLATALIALCHLWPRPQAQERTA